MEGQVTEPPAQPSDEALMALAQGGDRAAFATLTKRYEKRLYNYIRRSIGNGAEAEDLFQETFLRVYRNLDRFRTSARFRPWVYRIATNLCRDYLRYHGRRPRISLENGIAGAEGLRVGDTLETSNPGPDAVAEGHEAEERLEAALARLPVKHRTVFLMARYEEMPYEEIARALRIPVGTVKSRMNKAVNILLAELKGAPE